MPDQFEFRTQSLGQKLTLWAVRGIIIWMMVTSIYVLGTTTPDTGEILLNASVIFLSTWAYANVIEAKTEIQELFVLPVQVNNAVECLVISIALSVLSWFF